MKTQPAICARIDFANPHEPGGVRLRHAFAAPRQVLVAQQPAQVRVVLDAVQAAAEQGASVGAVTCINEMVLALSPLGRRMDFPKLFRGAQHVSRQGY